MNKIYRDIFRAIHEGKWLKIEIGFHCIGIKTTQSLIKSRFRIFYDYKNKSNKFLVAKLPD